MKKVRKLLCVFGIIFALFSGEVLTSMASGIQKTYINPIINEGADPWVVQAGGAYYYCGSDGDRSIYITKSDNLEDFQSGVRTLVFQTKKGTECGAEVWAPELHYVWGNWYIYFAADNGNNDNHRMYVARGGTNKDNPLDGSYSLIGKITDSTDRWAIDGTVLESNDQLYFIWSGWEGAVNVKQNIYIASMSNPWTISGNRVCISTPDCSWEQNGTPWVNEGPQVLKKGNAVHIIYSASGSWTNEYCLGRLTCTNGNFLDAASWVKTGPVFSQANGVYGPGHASFVKSKDGMQDYIVYHAAKSNGSGWDRNIRTQMFTWHGDVPFFGEPISAGVELAVPSNGNYAPVTNNRVYTIVNVETGKCLDVPSGKDENSLQIQTWDQNGATAQQWKMVCDSDGYFNIIPMCAPSRALDNPAASTSDGVIMQLWSQNGHDAQKWRAEYLGDGKYRLINKASLKALEDNGTKVIQDDISNDENQLWYLKVNFDT